MVNYEFSPTTNPLYMHIVRFIAARHWLWEMVITSSTLMTLALELTMPLMIWNRKLRWIYICGCSVFHLSIALFMGLVCFSTMMLILLLSFVPGWTIREFFGRTSAPLLQPDKPNPLPPLMAKHVCRRWSRGTVAREIGSQESGVRNQE